MARYEARIREDPFDLATVTIVLWVYFSVHSRSEEIQKSQQRLILWVIEVMPRAQVAGRPLVSACRDLDFLDKARRLWLSHVEANPRDARLIGNAARFFVIHDGRKSEELFAICKAIEPQNPEWSWHLGSWYSRRKRKRPPRQDEPDWGAMCLAEYERVLALAPDSNWAAIVLPELANAAFATGDRDKARGYGERMLALVPKLSGAWRIGTAIHHGHTILGRVALAEGDVEQARARLMCALTATDRELLVCMAPHGPSTALAKDLLERGERACVLDYFRECARHWTRGSARLARWMKVIEEGGIPNFEPRPSIYGI